MLIFGAGNIIPPLGVLGAAVATLTADGFKAVLLLILFLRPENRRDYHTRPRRLHEPVVAKRLLRFGAGNGGQLFLGIGAFSVFHMLMGRYCTDSDGSAVATASVIAFTVNSLACIPMFGLGTAVSLLVAKCLGCGDATLARRVVRSARLLAAFYAAAVGAAFILFSGDLVAVFNLTNEVSGETARLAGSFLGMAALFFAAESMSVLYGNAIRGAGDTGFAMKVMAATGGGLFALPCLVAFLLGAGAFALWGVAIMYAFATAAVFWARYRGGKWERLLIIGRMEKGEDVFASPPLSAWGG